MNARFLICLAMGSLWFSTAGLETAWAGKDVRLALLIANQEGWVRDPKLKYVISGDLRPMARKLKSLGFTIHASLANQSPKAIRKAWKRVLKRLKQKPRVTTFFFYYTGHADKQYFHAGPKGPAPLSYTELASFLSRVRVRRRFVLLDACFSGELLRKFGSKERYKTLMEKGELSVKGIERSLSLTDLRKHFPNQGERVRGLQILSSSRFLSYESQRRRASVFTYHFLKGLHGKADLDRDGKISFNELFLYVKPRVRAETGQSPQQWLFRVGSETYGFAPVYNSALEIGAGLLGRLKVRVQGFVWRWHKKHRKSMRLAVSSGYGAIVWRRGKVCKRQRLYFPPGRVARLNASRWLVVACRPHTLLKKGDAVLPPRPAGPGFLDQWMLELQGGLLGTNGWLDVHGDLGGMGWVGMRHRYFALFVGGGGSQSRFAASGLAQHLLLCLRGEAGYRDHWGRFDLFIGAYVQVGLLQQDIASSVVDSMASLSLQSGLALQAGYWFHERFSLFLAADAGITPQFSTVETRFFFAYGLRLGVRLLLSQQSPF